MIKIDRVCVKLRAFEKRKKMTKNNKNLEDYANLLKIAHFCHLIKKILDLLGAALIILLYDYNV